MIPDLAGSVLSVTGPVDPATLGPTLMHEHIFIDIARPLHTRIPVADPGAAAEPLTLANISRVRLGAPNADNDLVADFDEQLAEVLAFRYSGGGTMVDVSNLGLGRDPRSLQRLSRASGLTLVMGAGWYERNFHPSDMAERSVDELADVIVRDITVGVGGTGIRAGIIGEVGVEGNPLHPDELTSVRASGRASRLTGAPITFHFGGHREEKFDVLDILAEEGVAPTSVVMGHAGELALDLDFARRILDRGVFIECDYLGAPGSPWGYLWPINDRKVARGLVTLAAEGYADQLVLAHDVCTKLQLTRYGGRGYDYISEHFLPVARSMGLSEEHEHAIMVGNPARALTFVSPRA